MAMESGLTFKIAATHLVSRKRQSIIAALGVTFGIAMFVSLIGYMTGLNRMIEELTLDAIAHVHLYNEVDTDRPMPLELSEAYDEHFTVIHRIRPKDEPLGIHNSLPIMDILRKDSRLTGVAPRVNTQVFYNMGATDLNGQVIGVDVRQEAQLFNLDQKIIAGDLFDLETTRNGIIIGAGLAKKMLLDVGDRLAVTTAKGLQFQMKVIAIFQMGVAEIDDTRSYVQLADAQKMLEESPDFITNIHVNLKNLDLAEEVALEYGRRFDVKALDFNAANAQIELGNDVRNMITYAVSFTLLMVAGFGIYNILNMMIYEKMDDIAILKATGFSGADVRNIFISQALIIGTIGGVLGLLLGYLGSLGIDQIPFETEALPTIKTMPVNYDIRYYLLGVSFALLTTFAAGYLPARKASRVDPVEIIRGS